LTTDKSRKAQTDSLRRILRLIGVQVPVDVFPWHQLQYEHIELIRTRLTENYAPNTVNLSLAALRKVLEAAWRLELISTDEYMRRKDVRAVRGHREPKGRHVQPGEIRRLFDACVTWKDPWMGSRNAALLALLFGAGMRRAEAAATNVADVELETGAIRLMGKGNKERTTYLPAGALEAVRTWVTKHRENIIVSQRRRASSPPPTLETDALLLSAKHGMQNCRMSEGGILYALNQVAARAGVKRFSPHDMRRTFIGEMLDAGADISSIQQMVGHASPTTTAKYDRRGERAKQRSAGLLHVPYLEEEDE
jgi:site-specific recombinase XerD